MKILVKGSIATEDTYEDICKNSQKVEGDEIEERSYEQYKNEFIGACRAIGTALSNRQHTIMVSVSSWEKLRSGRDATTYIVEGVNETPEKTKVILYVPSDEEPRDKTINIRDTVTELQELDKVEIEEQLISDGRLGVLAMPDVMGADAVILIGGRDGSKIIGYLAYSLGKPLVPITRFNGAAEYMSNQVVFTEYMRLTESTRLSPTDLRSTQAIWSPWSESDGTESEASESNCKNAEKIVDMTEKLIYIFQQRKSSVRQTLWLAVLSILLPLILWLFIFLDKLSFDKNLAFFALLYMSSLMGVGLRTLAVFRQPNSERPLKNLTPANILIDIAMTLVVAFGLGLFYLIGGISFTGKVVVIEDVNENFTSIAISMSILGLAAGYLFPLQILEGYLKSSITRNEGKD